MWNYYVKNGSYQGYNLGLDTSLVRKQFSNLSDGRIKLVSGKIIYNRKKQVESAYKKIEKLVTRFYSRMSNLVKNADHSPIIKEFQDSLSDYINKKKLFFKNPAFASEQEYRFVLKVHNDFTRNGNAMVDFRVGASGIITPYVEWKFGNLKAQLLKQITLSPMIEPELAKESFKRFLVGDVYRNIEIKPSSIKLRF